jgi:non-canonical purine NTP pyrophosphatase (RdgB/HAM1 family)
MNLTFVTGNQAKTDYLAKLLGVKFKHQKVELDEIQTTNLAAIGEHKARQAYEILQSPVLIDDVSLGFDALNGLPGPFVRFFVETDNGLEKLCRMLDNFESRGALATCVMVYYDGRTLEAFEKSLRGTISDQPRGENGYGWDKIFIPEGYTQTRAELQDDEYAEVYLTVRPIIELKKFLLEHNT